MDETQRIFPTEPLIGALGHVLRARRVWAGGDLEGVEGHLELAYRTLRHAQEDDLAERVSSAMREIEPLRAGTSEPECLAALEERLRNAERKAQSLGGALESHRVVRWCSECPYFHYLPETAYSDAVALCAGDPGSVFAVEIAKMNLERDQFCPRAGTRHILTWPASVE